MLDESTPHRAQPRRGLRHRERPSDRHHPTPGRGTDRVSVDASLPRPRRRYAQRPVAILTGRNRDAVAAKALADFYRKRIDEVSPVVADAVTRAEAPPGTNPAEVIRQLSAPLYYRFLTDTKPLTSADAEKAAAVTMAAVDAAVFVKR
jgi:hypothetical protein